MNDIMGNAYLQGIREGDSIPDRMDLDGSIEFEKENWSGELGKVFLNGDTFTIDEIDGTFTLDLTDGYPIVTDIESGAEYYSFLDTWEGRVTYTFIVKGIVRKDSMAEVAFAKLMYNL